MKRLFYTMMAAGLLSACTGPSPTVERNWNASSISITAERYEQCIEDQKARLGQGSGDLLVVSKRIEANCQPDYDLHVEAIQRSETISEERKAEMIDYWRTTHEGKVLDDLLATRTKEVKEAEARKDRPEAWKLDGTALVAADNLYGCVDAFVSRAMNQYDGYIAGRHLEPLVRKECRNEIDTLHHEIRGMDISNRGHLHLIGQTAYHTASGIQRIMEKKEAEVKQAEIRRAVGY